ncbi:MULTISPECIES: DNA primase [Pseudomonas]|jgi:DNA primase|uniref:DNA primase n=1 Tax=Ectopseudomonas oleovorans TaxID=301 RepID=A0A653B273_ECTOL|nr:MULTISPECIES: DNA primase [Pseudomonas]TNF21548.1 MAG: DNA primase [Pseudomonadales bacterium]CAE6958552.1 DNA primase [Pseudomonas oleovorans]QFT24140.1 DNA primase [Pseudomonas sp. THAF187a]QFT44328.1 DNA primase [Pseudomonas sp. THAF42]QTS85965.1 DNA primase [Pseudomonas khazarica]|tara:strand:- start:1218 stop:3218 length:2001 start_codon:yes stop_codon:yes gene_type:complete
MAGLIPQSFIDDLLNRTDIVDVVSSRIQLKKTGKNYSACCPFHKEKTPSFTVSPDKQFYYCFGCGAGGNALGFVMDHDQLEFPQAIEELAKRAGMDVPREESGRGHKPRQPVDSPLYPLLNAAAEHYRQALKSHPQRKYAVEYLKGRGLTGEIARDFGLGFAPPGWDNLLKQLGGDALQQKVMIDAGLLIENAENGRRYDRFRDRIMFPIRDSRGRVIAFGGRVLGDDKPKYLNSPETPVFHKGQELYGLYEARKHNRDLDEIMVVEGYMDVIALAQQGLRNAVATLGTATSEEHLKRLFRIVPSVLFCFDGDAAGRNAAWRALESTLSSLQDGRRARFLFLPDGEDPDTLVRAEGTDAFRARINQHAQPLADYFFQQLSEEADPRSLEGKAHLVTLAAPLIDKIPGNNLRALMRQRLSEITGLSGEALSQVASSPRSPAPSPASPAPGSDYPDYGDIPDSAYYDSLPDVGGYEQPAPPQQQYYERSNEGGKGNWKKDGGKWNKKGKGDFAPRAPRTAVSVESPHLIALRTLLHHPQLAQKVEDVSHFADEDDTYAQLLVALVGALQKTPNLRSLQLIARWHGTEQGRLLRALAEKEWLIKGDNLEQQFFDTITTLAHNQSQRRREKALRSIMQKSPSELTDEEKTLLREHYSLTSSQSSKSPTGA